MTKTKQQQGARHLSNQRSSLPSLPTLATLGTTISQSNEVKNKTPKKSNKQSIKFFKTNDLTTIKQANKALKEQTGSVSVMKKGKSGNPSGFHLLSRKDVANPRKTPNFNLFQQITEETEEEYQQIEEEIVDSLVRKLASIKTFYHGRIHHYLVIGFNSLSIALERNELAVVVINREWKKELVQLLMEICINKNIPFLLLSYVELVERLKAEEVVNLKTLNCFGLQRVSGRKSSAATKVSIEEVVDEEGISAVLDDIRDELLQQVQKIIY